MVQYKTTVEAAKTEEDFHCYVSGQKRETSTKDNNGFCVCARGEDMLRAFPLANSI